MSCYKDTPTDSGRYLCGATWSDANTWGINNPPATETNNANADANSGGGGGVKTSGDSPQQRKADATEADQAAADDQAAAKAEQRRKEAAAEEQRRKEAAAEAQRRKAAEAKQQTTDAADTSIIHAFCTCTGGSVGAWSVGGFPQAQNKSNFELYEKSPDNPKQYDTPQDFCNDVYAACAIGQKSCPTLNGQTDWRGIPVTQSFLKCTNSSAYGATSRTDCNGNKDDNCTISP